MPWLIYGGTTRTVALAKTPALSAITSLQWMIDAWIQYQVIGASGKFVGGGMFSMLIGGGTVISNCYNIALSASGVTGAAGSQQTVDTTVANTIDLQATWTVANASNTLNVVGGFVRIDG